MYSAINVAALVVRGDTAGGIKLSPLDGFTRILVPYTGAADDHHNKISVNMVIPKADIYYKRIDQQTVAKKLTNKLYLRWNKFLYDVVKSRINKLELPKKSGCSFIQVGHKRIFGGLTLWTIQEPTIFQIDRGDNFECVAQIIFLTIINDKEVYEVC